MAEVTQHKITGPSARQAGYKCSCGNTFNDEQSAVAHADGENYELSLQGGGGSGDKLPDEAEVVNQTDTKAAAPVDAQKPAATKTTPAGKQADAQTGEIVQDKPAKPAAPAKKMGDLSPFQQSQALVKKYATELLNDTRAAQFMTTMALIARKEPKFAQCTPESIVSAMMACVQLDLMPNTPEQYAYIIPYRNNQLNIMEAQFQVGYQGELELARRSGNIRKIKAELVFKGDKFDVEYAPEEIVTHKPDLSINRTNYDDITHAYAYAKLDNGEYQYSVMTKSEIDKIKSKAKAQGAGKPWGDWPTEMARKTVIKRLTKGLPASSHDNRLKLAAEIDSLSEAGKLMFNDGKFSARSENELSSGAASQIASASTKTEVNDILQALPVGERKAAVGAAQQRIAELEA